jgi:hypothetical protein
MATSANKIHDAEHRPLLNRPLVVVTENRDSIKYKSAPEPPILAADSRGLPSLRIYPLAAFQSQFERDLVITSRRTAPSKTCRSVRPIPFGRAGNHSSQPRGSSLCADKSAQNVATHQTACLV